MNEARIDVRPVEDPDRDWLAERTVALFGGTTNDNTDALRFFQRRGYVLAALHSRAVERSRELKPAIPETGLHGIPIRDEIEMEKRFDRLGSHVR